MFLYFKRIIALEYETDSSLIIADGKMFCRVNLKAQNPE